MIERTLAVLGVACYVASSLLAVVALFGPRPRGERAALALMTVGGTALASVLVFRWLQATSIPVFSRFEALTCYVLALSGAYLMLAAYRYMRGIAGILIPYATVVLLGGISTLAMDAGTPVPMGGPWLALHVVTAYVAYGVFTLASIHAVVYLMQDSNLKHKRLGVVWERLPSLETLDHIMSRLVGIAFLLLTVAIVLGFVLIHASGGGDKWVTDPKVLATIAMWIMLAVFVHMRASAD
ncbi:MAG: cytochrome c biogenesis protein CcsA, partial [bacterium]